MTCGQDFAAWLSVLRNHSSQGETHYVMLKSVPSQKLVLKKGTTIWSNASPSSSDKTRGGDKNKKQIILSPSHNLVLHIEF